MPLAFRLIYLYLPLYAISHITVAVSVTLISSASISISYAPGALISHSVHSINLMLATNVFIPYALLRSYARFCQTSAKEKRCNPQKKITTLSKPYSILTDTSYLPSVSTSAISFAVALTIRMPVSLIPSRSASSCRRCVFFSGGVSKRNWSTDIW